MAAILDFKVKVTSNPKNNLLDRLGIINLVKIDTLFRILGQQISEI